MGKNDCFVCKKTTNAVASNKAGSLRCSICDSWYHPPCVQVDTAMLDLIKKCEDSGMASPWSCSVCSSAFAKLDKSVKQVVTRVAVVETRTDSLEETTASLKDENVSLKKEMTALKEKMKEFENKASDNSGERVLEEVSERDSKERNLVVHKCFESEMGVEEEAQGDDLRSIQGLLNEIGLRDMVARDALIGWRRLGQKKDDGQSRPLLLIFKNRTDRDKLLDRAPRLSHNKEEDYRNISIVADLTMKQRQMEQEMFRKAQRLNLERTTAEISKNLVHKVLGRRGERVLRQVELRQTEMVSEEGRVVLREQGEGRGERGSQQRGEKRGNRSPGSSPPARRRVGGRWEDSRVRS